MRQLQAVNPIETEEVHGLKKMQKKKPQKTLIITHLTCISTRPGVLERSPALDDVMGTSMGSVGTGRGSRAAAVGPGASLTTCDRSRREPLGSHYPGGARPRPVVTQEVSMRKDQPHVPWAGCAGRCWCSVTKLPGLQELFPSLQRSGSGRAAEVGDAGPRFPFPSCPPAPSSSLPPGNRLCTPAAEQNPSRRGEFGTSCPHSALVPAEPGFGRKAAGISSKSQTPTCWDTAKWHQAGPCPPQHRSLLVPKTGSPSHAAGPRQRGTVSWHTQPACLCELTQG